MKKVILLSDLLLSVEISTPTHMVQGALLWKKLCMIEEIKKYSFIWKTEKLFLLTS